MKDDDDGANKANGAAQLTQRPQLFLEEIGPEDSADENTKSSEWSDEDGWRKRVGGKVAYFADAN